MSPSTSEPGREGEPLYPSDRKYTEQHEWVMARGSAVRIGITDFAQQALGDIVFVTLPAPGSDVEGGQSLGEIESTKSVSDVYAPVSGTVSAANTALENQPDLLNSDPYGDGWLVEIEAADQSALGALLDADGYEKHVAAS